MHYFNNILQNSQYQFMRKDKDQQQQLFPQIKKHLYCYNDDLLNQKLPHLLFYLLSFIELLQILGYCFNQQLQYSSIGIKEVSNFIKFLNPQQLLRQNSSTIYIMVPLFTLITILHIILIIYTFNNYITNLQNGFQVSRWMPLLHLVNVIYNTILIIPVFQVSIVTIYCSSSIPYHNDRVCYTDTYILLSLVSVINLLWMFINMVYYNVIYYSRNPFNLNCLSISSNWLTIGKTISKIIPFIFVLVDPQLQFQVLYLGSIGALTITNLLLFKVFKPCYKLQTTTDIVLLKIDVVFSVVFVMMMPQHFLYHQQANTIAFIYSFLIGGILSIICSKLIFFRKKRLVGELVQFEKDKASIIEQFLFFMNELIDTSCQNKKNMKILHIVRLHWKKCVNPQCSCHKYLKQIGKKCSFSQNYELGFQILRDIIYLAILKYPKNSQFKILHSYVLYYRLQSKFSAIFQLSKLITNKISLSQEHSIRPILYKFQKQYKDNTSIDIYIKFTHQITKLEDQIVNLSIIFSDYWNQLGDGQSSIIKLWKLISEIRTQKASIQQLINQLQKIYPDSIKLLKIACQMYQYIVHDEEKYEFYRTQRYEKIQNLNEIKLKEAGVAFGPNSDLLSFTTIINKQNCSQIISCTSNCKKILEYEKQDLLGQPLNKIMPEIYCQFHDKMINNYFKQSDKLINLRQLMVFPIKSNGYIVRCMLRTKVIASFKHGAHLISFLKKQQNNKKQYYVIYNSLNGVVDSMTQDLSELVGLSKDNKVINIKQIAANWDTQSQKMVQGQLIDSIKIKKITHTNIKLLRTDGIQHNVKILEITNSLNKNNPFRLNKLDTYNIQSQFQPKTINNPLFKQELKSNKKRIYILLNGAIILIWIVLWIFKRQLKLSQRQVITNIRDLADLSFKIQHIIVQTTLQFQQNTQPKQKILKNIQQILSGVSNLRKINIGENNINSMIIVQYLINKQYITQNQTVVDATFQLVNNLRQLIENDFITPNRRNQLNFYVQTNSVKIISKIYGKYGQVLRQNVIQNQISSQKNTIIISSFKLLLCFLSGLNILIYTLTQFQIILNVMKLHTKLQRIKMKFLAEQCKKLTINFSQQGQLAKKTIKKRQKNKGQIKSFLRQVKRKVNKNQKPKVCIKQQQEQLQFLKQKINFQAVPSKINIIRIIVLSSFFLIGLQIPQIYLALQYTKDIKSQASLINIGKIGNSLGNIMYYSNQVIIQRNLYHQLDLKDEINLCYNLIIGLNWLNIGNTTNEITGILQQLEYVINFKNQLLNEMSYRIIEGQISNSIDKLSLLYKEQKEKLTNLLNEEEDRFKKGFLIGEIILLFLYLKFVIFELFVQVSEKRFNTVYMLKIISSHLRKQLMNENL